MKRFISRSREELVCSFAKENGRPGAGISEARNGWGGWRLGVSSELLKRPLIIRCGHLSYLREHNRPISSMIPGALSGLFGDSYA